MIYNAERECKNQDYPKEDYAKRLLGKDATCLSANFTVKGVVGSYTRSLNQRSIFCVTIMGIERS